MDYDGVLSELVEVWNRFNENGGRGGHAGELARAYGLENGEKRVRILADRQKLEVIVNSFLRVTNSHTRTSGCC